MQRPSLDVPGLAPPSQAAQLGAEIGERVRELEPRAAVLEHRDRLLQQREPIRLVERGRGAAQRHPELTRRADAAGDGELFAGEPRGGLRAAVRGERGGRVRPPVARPVHAQRLEALAAPEQVRDALLDPALGDPQAPAGGEVLADEHAILGDPQRVALAHQLGRRRERPALDVGDDRDREELQRGEVPLVDHAQSGLRLDLGVLERALRERERRALAVDQPLPRHMALAAGALHPGVEHAHGQVVAPSEPQGLQRDQGGARRRGRREPGGQRGLRLLHRERG